MSFFQSNQNWLAPEGTEFTSDGNCIELSTLGICANKYDKSHIAIIFSLSLGVNVLIVYAFPIKS